MNSAAAPTQLAPLLNSARVIVCCGPGGVGKTTTAAALGIAAAAAGRRVTVLTVDPARRLANALGLTEFDGHSRVVEGAWPGELRATMLDAKSTFDGIVSTYAADQAQAERILNNRIYRNLSSALSGTQEYMAIEKLYELATAPDADLVIVDTPPTRHALDVLDAPERLLRLLENKVFRALMAPTKTYLKVVNAATQTLLRTVARTLGSDVIDDVVAFFRAFEGMEDGFRTRAQGVRAVLEAPTTSFLLVCSARRDAVDESVFFARELVEHGHRLAALVVNRVHPSFDVSPALVSASANSSAGGSERGRGELASDVAALVDNAAQMTALARREAQHISRVEREVAGAISVKVPLFFDDVHDLEGLAAIGSFLVGSAGSVST